MQIPLQSPQMHQQICQESTFTRYLDVFNTGDSTLVFSAVISPDTLSWVSTSPLSGEIEPGDTSQIEFNFNSTGLPLNNYYADLVINSNDPENPELVVLTMLHVQILTILLNAEDDSICQGCSTQLTTIVFGCSEAYSFNWDSDPPGFSSTEKSPVMSPQVNTTYTVTVTDGNYSSQKSVEIKVYGSSGLTENQTISEVSVYPNPGNDILNLKFISEYSGRGMIRITDLSGRMLLSENVLIYKGLNERSVRSGNIKPGVYLLSVQAENKAKQAVMVTRKIVVY